MAREKYIIICTWRSFNILKGILYSPKKKVERAVIPGRGHIFDTWRFAPNSSQWEPQLPRDRAEEAAAISPLIKALGSRQLVRLQILGLRVLGHLLTASRDSCTRHISLYYRRNSSVHLSQQFLPRRRGEVLLRNRFETPRADRRRGLVRHFEH